MILLYISDESLTIAANELVSITNSCKVTMRLPQANQIYLQLDKNGLAIVSREFGVTYIKDLYRKLLERLKKTSSELLIQGIKSTNKLNILDLTAGLGRDSILMANAGHRVLMLERNPALAVILNYVIKYKIVTKTENLKIINIDSSDYLNQSLETLPDIIYLDPMFQDNSKAKSKKDMQLIDLLLSVSMEGILNGDAPLFNLAYKTALNKVIVKRDNKQKPLVEKPLPTYSKSGKTVRYDIYIKPL